MKKTYFSPRTRYVDLHTESLMQTLSQLPTDPNEGTDYALSKDQSIWNSWSEDDK